MVLWDDVFKRVAVDYPDVATRKCAGRRDAPSSFCNPRSSRWSSHRPSMRISGSSDLVGVWC